MKPRWARLLPETFHPTALWVRLISQNSFICDLISQRRQDFIRFGKNARTNWQSGDVALVYATNNREAVFAPWQPPLRQGFQNLYLSDQIK